MLDSGVVLWNSEHLVMRLYLLALCTKQLNPTLPYEVFTLDYVILNESLD